LLGQLDRHSSTECGTVLIPSNVSLEALRPRLSDGFALSAYGKRKDRRRITPTTTAISLPLAAQPAWSLFWDFSFVALRLRLSAGLPCTKELSYHLFKLKERKSCKKIQKSWH